MKSRMKFLMPSRGLARAALAFAAFGLASGAAQGPLDVRVALVIGNSAYRHANVLPNATKDAAGVAQALKLLGFRVEHVADGSRSDMQDAVARMQQLMDKRQALAMLYYAGHGLQVAGEQNFMIPVDARITTEKDLPQTAVGVESVLGALTKAGTRMNILVLDACRENPFRASGIGGNSGLAQMRAPAGTFLAYSTQPGAVAEDGDEKAPFGPYADALINELGHPMAKVEDVFKRVRYVVRRKTDGRQIPWDATTLEEDFVFNQVAVKMSAAEIQRMIAEAKRREEQARLEAERARQRERELAEQAERARIEAEAAARRKREEEAIARQREREAAERAEQARLQAEAEAKRRREEEELARQREREREAAAKAERERLEAEAAAARRRQEEALARQREREAAESAERARVAAAAEAKRRRDEEELAQRREREREAAAKAERERLEAEAAARRREQEEWARREAAAREREAQIARERAAEAARKKQIEEQLAAARREQQLQEEAAARVALQNANEQQKREELFRIEKAKWDKLRESRDPEPLYDFLLAHPNGAISELAQARLETVHPAKVQPQADSTGLQQPLAAKRFRVGDRYEFIVRDLLTRLQVERPVFTVTRATDEEAEFDQGYRVTQAGAIIRTIGGATLDPYQQWIPSGEYSVGRKWYTRSIMRLPNGQTMWVELNGKVVARETIEVPAGRFDTFKMEMEQLAQDGTRLKITYWGQPDWGVAIKQIREVRDTVGALSGQVYELAARSRR